MSEPAGDLSLSRRKQLAFVVILLLAFFLLVEIVTRVGHSLFTGSTYGILYGLPGFLNRHQTKFDGYFKYGPDETLHQQDVSPPIAMRINSLGFRGDDFDPDKPDGVFRVISLGGSSTYGYYARDGHTYPDALERILGRSGGDGFEVINMGLPHYTTSNLRALMEKEAADYEPDLVTFYSGNNDTVPMRHKTEESGLVHLVKPIYRHVFFVRFSASGLRELYHRERGKQGGAGAFGVKPLAPKFLYDADRTREEGDEIEALFRANVEALIALSKERGFSLLFIRQPTTTRYFTGNRLEEPLPYDEEVALIQSALDEEGEIWGYEASMLVHTRLMDILEALSVEHGITMIDGTEHTDEHLEHLVSWVHLSEEGNEDLAQKIAAAYFATADRGGRTERAGL